MFTILITLLATTASLVSGAGVSGWTYVDTPSTCAGTTGSPCGPEYWGKVSGASACGTELWQTPINIGNLDVEVQPDLKVPQFKSMEGGCKEWTQFTSTGVFEIDFNVAAENAFCDNLKVTHGGEDFHLLQMHLHSPSEHTIGGGVFSAEAHMVHKSSSGKYLVVGVLLDATPSSDDSFDNDFFLALWGAGGYTGSNSAALFNKLEAGQQVTSEEPLNPYLDLTPGSAAMYHYNGSLTTPPCMVPNGVSWWLFQEPVQISLGDLNKIRGSVKAHAGNILDTHGGDARPTQPLNGRKIYSAEPPVPPTTKKGGKHGGKHGGGH